MSVSFALSLATAAGDAAGQGTSRSLSGVAQLIAENASNFRVNRTVETSLSKRIQDFVDIITAAVDDAQNDEADDWTPGLQRFKETLEDVQQTLQTLGNQSYIAQVVHGKRDTETLKALAQRVTDAFATLMVTLHMDISEQLSLINKTFDSLLEDAAFTNIEPHIPRLPPIPQLFLGRDSEISAAVALLDSDSPAHVAILGGPGMGKTSLTVAALHDVALSSRFGNQRYFVPCDAAEEQPTCLGLIHQENWASPSYSL
ncbi:hypothetical protein EXIGLDRAFT_832143 [Exidia glandulosa HHB12029]|uniref:Mixed lineage kinase domain-containing protein n=1 Tax=Exidia glandulosa HHB12029 TaxID=1314781 RepID=A0A165M0K0_EXIGL|nr:hypothetical protein EXIGLDRAFT_832143 [Exidia glandulosa HHB12029]